MIAIRLRDVVALVGGFPALAGVDLKVARGEIVLIRGVNGAGKTTLLRVCAGLLRPASGTAEVLGYDLADSSGRLSARRRVGLLGHDTALYGDLTAGENLKLWVRAARVDPAAVSSAFGRVGITRHVQDVPVSRLSAGQRRRVAIAAVIVRRPDVWLLDEPYTSLDQRSCELVSGVIAEAAGSGATVVVASHETGATAALGARLVTMAAGAVTAGARARRA